MVKPAQSNRAAGRRLMSKQEIRKFVESEINVCIDLWKSGTAKGRRESRARCERLLKHRNKRIAAKAFFRLIEMKWGPPAER